MVGEIRGTKKRTIVEYALKESKKPIGVAQYKITPKLPKELKGEFPTQEEMQKLLGDI